MTWRRRKWPKGNGSANNSCWRVFGQNNHGPCMIEGYAEALQELPETVKDVDDLVAQMEGKSPIWGDIGWFLEDFYEKVEEAKETPKARFRKREKPARAWWNNTYSWWRLDRWEKGDCYLFYLTRDEFGGLPDTVSGPDSLASWATMVTTLRDKIPKLRAFFDRLYEKLEEPAKRVAYRRREKPLKGERNGVGWMLPRDDRGAVRQAWIADRRLDELPEAVASIDEFREVATMGQSSSAVCDFFQILYEPIEETKPEKPGYPEDAIRKYFLPGMIVDLRYGSECQRVRLVEPFRSPHDPIVCQPVAADGRLGDLLTVPPGNGRAVVPRWSVKLPEPEPDFAICCQGNTPWDEY